MRTRVSLYLGAIVFGITDSLVSTVGLLAGVTAGGASARLVVLTGVVYAFVEAFSMAVGNFLSEESAEEYAARGDVSDALPLAIGAIMFFSFMLASLVPLAPYLLLPGPDALPVSILASLAALALAGAAGARLSRVPAASRALRMALLGGAAIALGILIGRFFPGV